MNDRLYILNDRTPVRCINHIAWSQRMNGGSTRVAKDIINNTTVSTVFMGMDHNFSGDGPPLLFETMVFGGDAFDGNTLETVRTSTWEEAEAAHEEICNKIQAVLPNCISSANIKGLSGDTKALLVYHEGNDENS